MIQVNLLPDVKLEYIKAQNLRRVITFVSVIVTSLAIVILVLLLLGDFYDKHRLSDLNSKVALESSELRSKPAIGKVLTVQNQVASLNELHTQDPAVYNLFNSYLNELTPNNASISNLQIDFTQNTVIITGTADSLATVDQYVDTLKFSTFTSGTSTAKTNAFSDVVLASFGINTGATDPTQATTYTLDATFNKALFDVTQTVKLNVPSQITTRSDLEQPGDLFKAAPTAVKSGTGS